MTAVVLWAVATGGCLLVAAVLRSPTAAVGPDTSLAQVTGQLQRSLRRLVTMPDGPPGVIVVVRRGGHRAVYQAGTASLARRRPLAVSDHARLGGVSAAYGGAVALSLVSQGKLALADTIGKLLPRLPRRWHPVTLAELLAHRSGLPSFTASAALARRLQRPLAHPLMPARLLHYVRGEPLRFRPGSRYSSSETDDLVVTLMARAAGGRSYPALLHELVLRPARLHQTSIPAAFRLPRPFLAGYAPGHPPADVTAARTPATVWAGGSLVSTAANTDAFVRAELAGRFFSRRVQAAQLRFRPGRPQLPGPGENAAGLGIFRFATRCGTVYGAAGSVPGYAQFGAASRDGADSVTVTATGAADPRHPQVRAALRQTELLAVCAALARR